MQAILTEEEYQEFLKLRANNIGKNIAASKLAADALRGIAEQIPPSSMYPTNEIKTLILDCAQSIERNK